MRPSFEGTSATSLISCVCTDIRSTRVSGKTTWMPGPSASDDTEPKKSLTPTCPAGTVLNGPCVRRINANTTSSANATIRPGRGDADRVTSNAMVKSSADYRPEDPAGVRASRDQISVARRAAASDVRSRAGHERV